MESVVLQMRALEKFFFREGAWAKRLESSLKVRALGASAALRSSYKGPSGRDPREPPPGDFKDEVFLSRPL